MDKHENVFVDFNTISFSDWAQRHKAHRRQYDETEDNERRFRFVRCLDCGEMYYLGEYNVGE